MRVAFADSYFYLALLNPRDAGHQNANDVASSFDGIIFTTEWVLVEVADACSQSKDRPKFERLMKTLDSDPNVQIVPADSDSFRRGIEFYHSRPDKNWSLTDCFSFLAMNQHSIQDALTGDHHFSQAGFTLLLNAE